MKRLALAIVSLFAAGCGGGAYLAPQAAYAPAPAEPAGQPVSTMDGAFAGHGAQANYEAEYRFADEAVASGDVELSSAGGAPAKKAEAAPSYGKERPEQKPAEKQAANAPETDEPLVVYMGYLKLRVKRPRTSRRSCAPSATWARSSTGGSRPST
jgi:hypothetical protein